MKIFAHILMMSTAFAAGDPVCGVNRNRLSLYPSSLDALSIGMVTCKDVRAESGPVAGYTNTLVRKNIRTSDGAITITNPGWYMIGHGWKIKTEHEGTVVSHVYASDMPIPVFMIQSPTPGAIDAGNASALYLAQAGERLHVVTRSTTPFTVLEGILTAVQQFD
jgi:hypothetical protein